MADRAEVKRILDEIARRLLDERIEQEMRKARRRRRAVPPLVARPEANDVADEPADRARDHEPHDQNQD